MNGSEIDLREAIEAHSEASIVDDSEGRLTIEVPRTIPSDLDDRFREADAEVVRKSATRFEVQT